MPTFRLTLAYDGTDFLGWQRQPKKRTIQEELEAALGRVTTWRPICFASGRTDAGVHALGQVVSFDSATRLQPDELTKALNAELPEDMHVFKVERAPDGFHAQKDAVRKRYRYLLEDGRTRDLFARNYLWHIFQRLDVEAMQAAANTLLGTHDFISYEGAGSSRLTTERTIFDLFVERRPSELTERIAIEVEADGFLYNMVRKIVGTLVQIGKGKEDIDWPVRVLKLRDRRKTGMTAPAQGLYLVGVHYDDSQCGVRSAECGMDEDDAWSSDVGRIKLKRRGFTFFPLRIPHSAFPPMRIAHIITRMIIGGAQENTLFNCEDLIRIYNDEVLLITGPALGPEGDLLGQGRGGGVPLKLIPSLRRAIDPWRDSTSYFELKRAIRAFKPEVVHTHSAKAGFLGRLAASALDVPVIIHTVHGAPFHDYQSAAARSIFRWCEWHAAQHCHALISVADAMTDLMVKAGVAPREKFTTIYSGMDVEPLLKADEHRAAIRSQLGYQPRHVVIGKIARLFHLKGHADVIRAAAEVIRANDNVRFLFIGDGILRDELQNQIQAAGLTNYFHFAGLVPPADIPKWIGAMDILVHASLREGLARALPQALIAGKPVVSYDIDGAREVAINDQTGYLVPPRWDALVEPLSKLAADAELRSRLGQTGRERFTDQFRHEFMTSRIRKLYERVLGGMNAASGPKN